MLIPGKLVFHMEDPVHKGTLTDYIIADFETCREKTKVRSWRQSWLKQASHPFKKTLKNN